VSYTLLNLRTDVEDMAPRFQMGEGIEAHFARKALELERSGLAYFKLSPDYVLPFGHVHSEQEEIYLVLSGSARVKLDDEEVELEPLDAVRIPAGVTRGMAGGPDGAELIAFGAPNNENGDLEMIPGFFTSEAGTDAGP
jgi:mannose-6-phosphate isomerase-like protein (cupin superfamily)